MILSLLVAADENNVIGKDNKLIWYLPDDLKYFKNQTWGLPVVMGRKTFDSIGKPLRGRKNIVITRNKSWQSKGIEVVHTIPEAIEKASEYDVKETFVIGGAEIYRLAFEMADKIYITRIHHHFEGDAYFPDIPVSEWELVKKRFCNADEKNIYPHTFQVWQRISSAN
ncbi:MAG TPA: dihydrofolate reductase [Flavisolibacter sp.]|nr:dihydrofolate reductase [Flavisolibacter sp.]